MNEDEIDRLLYPRPEEIPFEDFQRNAAEHVGRLRETGRPAILTVDGEKAVVVQSAEAYRRLLDLVDRARTIIAARRGLDDARRGEMLPLDETFEETRERGEFQRNAAEHIGRLRETGRPMVLAAGGEAELVVQSTAGYQRLFDTADRADAIIGIHRGLEEVDRGDALPLDEAFEEIRARAAARRRTA